MKIGFDISQTLENKAGCAFMADQLIRAIAGVDKENDYLLYERFYDYQSPNTSPPTRIDQDNFTSLPMPITTPPNDELYGCVDIVQSNNYRFPYGLSAKKVVVLYDAVILDVPQFTTEANRIVCLPGVFDSMLFADAIITISHFSKARLLHFFPAINPDKVTVCHIGNRSTLLQLPSKVQLLHKLGLEENNYFLAVGTVEPRKNYSTLLEAYREFMANTRPPYKKLCIAGGIGWLETDFRERIDQMGLTDSVCITGYVDEATLSNLYRHCHSFIFPSWYEGFGLPILEAMGFKKPVIASNAASIPEVTGDAALLYDPGDMVGFAEGMALLDSDQALARTLAHNGYEYSQQFTWRRTAEKVVQIYRELVG